MIAETGCGPSSGNGRPGLKMVGQKGKTMLYANETTRAAVKALRNENKKALQFCNAVSKINFEKPFIAARTCGKFTVKTIKDTVSFYGTAQPWVAVVMFKDCRYNGYRAQKLHVVTLDSRSGKFSVDLGKVYTFDFGVDNFYCISDFEEARKACSGTGYVIAQTVENLNEKPAPRSVKYVDALKNGERFRNPVVQYGSTYVTRIDGKGERVEAFPRSRYGWSDYVSDSATGMLSEIVDKSGYSALPALIARRASARELRAVREAAKAAAFDCTAREKELSERVEALRVEVMDWIANYNGTVKTYSEYRIMDAFVNAVHELHTHKQKREAGKYSSIGAIEIGLGYVEKYLNAADELLHPKQARDIEDAKANGVA